MKLFRMLVPLVMAAALAGCSALPDSAVTKDAKLAVQTALLTYADVYQPAVLTYGRLPVCPNPTPSGSICHDPIVLAKLKATDLAVTNTISAAQGVLEGTATDSGQLTAALNAISQAEAQIAASGVLVPHK